MSARQLNDRKPVLRSQYRKPDVSIERIELWFDLAADATEVEARLHVRRAPHAPQGPIRLDGERLTLLSITLDGRTLKDGEYQIDDTGLTIAAPPAPAFVLTTRTRIEPAANSELLGLYGSCEMLLTQCEAQGFRRITYFPDRPDVLTRYTVCLRADRERYPVLLSNGNLIEEGRLPDGRHFATWHDPHPKPSYLFALVAGRLQCRESRLSTRSGRAVLLQLWAAAADLPRLEHAQRCLERAIAWDEQRFGFELDLDRYMVVAVRDFNFGAMENKGLNLFSTRYVLAAPSIATDADYAEIEAVIGHEYFHNWTGNRVTCRDWFQLSLKEGLTVYREQEFVQDMLERGPIDPQYAASARSVPRIEAVRALRSAQFAEDAGPMAHPVRPDSYLEINNFYTATVYRKGAEITRMLATLIGQDGFRRGLALFISRHDGSAAVCEDFVVAMAAAAGRDLRTFLNWYSQAGTPRVSATPLHDERTGVLELTLVQSCAPTPGQADKEPFLIPLAFGLIGPGGAPLPVHLEDGAQDRAGSGGPGQRGQREGAGDGQTVVLELSERAQTFRFRGVPAGAVPSLLRNFSAPVTVDYPYTGDQLAHLAQHDTDPWSRWDALQRLLTGHLAAATDAREADLTVHLEPAVASLVRRILLDQSLAPAFRELSVRLPDEAMLAELRAIVVPEALREARLQMQHLLGRRLHADWMGVYRSMQTPGPYSPEPQYAGRRALKNLALEYLVASGDSDAVELARDQLYKADNLTDRMAALVSLVNSRSPAKAGLLLQLARDWCGEPLLMNKWFQVQATAVRQPGEPPVLERVRMLLRHGAYNEKDPQTVDALVVAFCIDNPAEFHAPDGSGYAFWVDQVDRLDAINPIIAARVARALTRWRRFAPDRQRLMRQALKEVAARPSLSFDVREVLERALEA